MNRNERLVKNTFLYFIGNFASKILSFVLLPLYTSFLTPQDYGRVDLIFMYTSIIIPLFTLQITFAGFRFLFDTEDENERELIISSTFFVHLVGMILFCLLFFIFWIVTKYEYGLFVILYVLLNNISSSTQQIIRGLKRNTVYVMSSMVGTTIQLLSNVLFILGFGLKSMSLIISPIIGYFVILVMIYISTDVVKYISTRGISFLEIKRMLKYSTPLVPDSICWWVLMGFGRIYLNHFYGPEMVGILAVANKFPGLLTMIYSIFNLAWQENSFSEYNKRDRNEYYSNMYNGLIKFLFPIIIISIPIVKITSPVMLSDSFSSAYLYVPILFLGSLFSMMSSFYASGFESAKRTNGIMVSTLVALIVNLCFNVLLVPKYGILGLSIALVFSYFSLLFMRIMRSRKFFHIKVDKRNMLISFVFLIVAFIVYYKGSVLLQVITIFIGCIYFFLLNYNLIHGLINKLIRGRIRT